MTEIVNITYTVNPKVAQGRERFKNTVTGEEWWGSDPDQPELDFAGDPDVFVQTRGIGEPLPIETLHINAEDVMSLPMETLTDKAVKAMPAKKGRDKVKE
jgi:hypothetical protein